MTNEEFQRIVIEKLTNLETRVGGIEVEIVAIKDRVSGIEDRVASIEEIQIKQDKKLDAVIEHPADLTEFKVEMIHQIKEMKRSIARIEIATADNWGDIARLKAAR